jgi:hypothetical protein
MCIYIDTLSHWGDLESINWQCMLVKKRPLIKLEGGSLAIVDVATSANRD